MKETPEVLGEVSSADENQEGREEWKINRCCLPRRASQVALVVKNPPANTGDARDTGSIPGWERSAKGGHGNPLQYSCLENPHGQRSLVGYGPQGHKELTGLSDVCTHTFLGKGKGALIQTAGGKRMGTSSLTSGTSWVNNLNKLKSWQRYKGTKNISNRFLLSEQGFRINSILLSMILLPKQNRSRLWCIQKFLCYVHRNVLHPFPEHKTKKHYPESKAVLTTLRSDSNLTLLHRWVMCDFFQNQQSITNSWLA